MARTRYERLSYSHIRATERAAMTSLWLLVSDNGQEIRTLPFQANTNLFASLLGR